MCQSRSESNKLADLTVTITIPEVSLDLSRFELTSHKMHELVNTPKLFSDSLKKSTLAQLPREIIQLIVTVLVNQKDYRTITRLLLACQQLNDLVMTTSHVKNLLRMGQFEKRINREMHDRIIGFIPPQAILQPQTILHLSFESFFPPQQNHAPRVPQEPLLYNDTPGTGFTLLSKP